MDADKLRELGVDPEKWEEASLRSSYPMSAWFAAAIEAGRQKGSLEATPAVVKDSARDAFIREAAKEIVLKAGIPMQKQFGMVDVKSTSKNASDVALIAADQATALADALGL